MADAIKCPNCFDEIIIVHVLTLILTVIITFCLKKQNTNFLFIILSLILSYLVYENVDKYYIMPIIGFIIWLVDIIFMQEYVKNKLYKKLINDSWKIPFWGILTYYLSKLGTVVY